MSVCRSCPEERGESRLQASRRNPRLRPLRRSACHSRCTASSRPASVRSPISRRGPTRPPSPMRSNLEPTCSRRKMSPPDGRAASSRTLSKPIVLWAGERGNRACRPEQLSMTRWQAFGRAAARTSRPRDGRMPAFPLESQRPDVRSRRLSTRRCPRGHRGLGAVRQAPRRALLSIRG